MSHRVYPYLDTYQEINLSMKNSDLSRKSMMNAKVREGQTRTEHTVKSSMFLESSETFTRKFTFLGSWTENSMFLVLNV